MSHFVIRRGLLGVVALATAGSLAACGSSTKTSATTSAPKAVATTLPGPNTTKAVATTVKPAVPTVTTVGATTAKANPATTAAGTTTPIVKISANTATDAELMKVPGVTTAVMDVIKKGRPYATVTAFRTALTKSMTVAQETEIEKYFSF